MWADFDVNSEYFNIVKTKDEPSSPQNIISWFIKDDK